MSKTKPKHKFGLYDRVRIKEGYFVRDGEPKPIMEFLEGKVGTIVKLGDPADSYTGLPSYQVQFDREDIPPEFNIIWWADETQFDFTFVDEEGE